MKKSILLFTFLAFSLYSCSSSDSNENNSNVDVTDIDGNTYQTVNICDQTWMKSNLNVSKYRNGDEIPQVTDATQWANLTTGAWCYLQNNTSNGPIYGKLYNWYAVNDPRGLAPNGWHIPSKDEWAVLRNCLGGENIAGGKMKALTLWNNPNVGASNESGFTGLPGGIRDFSASFTQFSDWGYFWSSTQNGVGNSWKVSLYYDSSILGTSDDANKVGISVRCVKN